MTTSLFFQILSLVLSIPYIFLAAFFIKMKRKGKKNISAALDREPSDSFREDFSHLVD